jgi:glycerophosphoryl diester phosphodiesterase
MSLLRFPLRTTLIAVSLVMGQGEAMSAEPAKSLSSPIVIAHRGASGERPEHTLAAYDLAIQKGADVIEPDLVPTTDGHLVARHENEISGTTDVAAHPEFADRKTTKTIDGQTETGWFTEDFTLAELKSLRARERLPQLRSTAYDGQFEIPTLEEIIALAKQRTKETGRTIAIYPETKHPTYFASIGKGTDAPLVDALDKAGWKTADAPVFIQSFEVNNLKHIKTMTGIRLIQLVAAEDGPADKAAPSYAAMMTPEGLKQVATYAWGIGPDKAMLWKGDAPTTLVADAHAAGLRVHPWTYRAENQFVRVAFRKGTDPKAHGDVAGEIRAALGQGIDGFFTDFPQIGVETRNAFLRTR